MRNSLIFGLVLFCSLSVSAARAEEAFFNANRIKIRYITAGQGEAVILLHGFAVRSSEEMWIKNALNEPQVVAELSRDYRVIAMDWRGHGKSGKPRGVKNYGLEMVEDVVRLMDHLKIKQAHIVGYSLGAIVAGKLLVTHPDRLLSVTLGGGAPVYQPTKKWQVVVEELAKSLDKGAGAGPLVPVIAPAGEPAPSQEAMNVLGQLLVFGQDQKVLASVIRGIVNLEVTTEQLKANKIPVLVVYGNREGEALERIGRFVPVLAQVEVQVIAGGDHMTTFARPEFRTAIHKFLNSHRN
ncbi:MAG: hydrolase [Planctomycetaceae bacterium]|nr:hydrolase [Planctomycetaceae bacterium]